MYFWEERKLTQRLSLESTKGEEVMKVCMLPIILIDLI